MLPGTYPSFIYLFSPLIPLKTNQVGLVRGLVFPFGFGVLSIKFQGWFCKLQLTKTLLEKKKVENILVK